MSPELRKDYIGPVSAFLTRTCPNHVIGKFTPHIENKSKHWYVSLILHLFGVKSCHNEKVFMPFRRTMLRLISTILKCQIFFQKCPVS